MFDGWMQLAGNEVINAARTMAYVNTGYIPAGVNVMDCLGCDSLAEMLGDKKYESPMIDEAPWFESGNPDTWDFAGVLPLEITGLNGSTRRATVTEMVSDGGSVSGVRFASRTIAVTALLLGKTSCAVEAGLSWLSTVLAGSKCSGPPTSAARSACEGDELCVLTCCPDELADVPMPGQTEIDAVPIGRWVGTGGFYDATTGTMEPNVKPPGTYRNLVRNPSFESATPFAFWTADAAASISPDLWPSRQRSHSAKLTGSVAAPGVIATTLTDIVAGDIGKVLNMSLAVGAGQTSDGMWSQVGARVTVSGLSASPVTKFIGLRGGSYDKVNISVPITTVSTPTITVTLRNVDNTGNAPTGAVLYVDAVNAQVETARRVLAYFDGETNDTPTHTYTWEGTPEESASTVVVTAPVVSLTGQPIECIDEAAFDFGVSTIEGPVRLQAQALALDGSVLWTGPWLTVSGVSPAVTILPETEWGTWVPRLIADPALPNAFEIAPVLSHAKYKTAQECLDEITRSFLDVTTIEGPTVVDVFESSCGERYYKVEWTMVAGNPAMLGPIVPFVTRMHSDTGGGMVPYAAEFATAYQVTTGLVVDPVNDVDTRCLTTEASATLNVFDPCCPGFLAPPTLPYIADTCFDRPTTYHRSWVQIPKDYAPEIEDGLLSMEVLNDNHSKRGLRIRVYPDPIGSGISGISECDFCDEFFITYIPPNATWRLDGPSRRVTTQPTGRMQQIVSSASVRGRDGGPFDFPAMQCNTGFLIAVDVPDQYPENCGNDCAGQTQGDVWVSVSMRRAST